MIICDGCDKKVKPSDIDWETNQTIKLGTNKIGDFDIRIYTHFEEGYFLCFSCALDKVIKKLQQKRKND